MRPGPMTSTRRARPHWRAARARVASALLLTGCELVANLSGERQGVSPVGGAAGADHRAGGTGEVAGGADAAFAGTAVATAGDGADLGGRGGEGGTADAREPSPARSC